MPKQIWIDFGFSDKSIDDAIKEFEDRTGSMFRDEDRKYFKNIINELGIQWQLVGIKSMEGYLHKWYLINVGRLRKSQRLIVEYGMAHNRTIEDAPIELIDIIDAIAMAGADPAEDDSPKARRVQKQVLKMFDPDELLALGSNIEF